MNVYTTITGSKPVKIPAYYKFSIAVWFDDKARGVVRSRDCKTCKPRTVPIISRIGHSGIKIGAGYSCTTRC